VSFMNAEAQLKQDSKSANVMGPGAIEVTQSVPKPNAKSRVLRPRPLRSATRASP
jgi:hypothetical protein